MYGAILNTRPAFGGMIQVHDLHEIEHLVKESEVVTGKPGRKFVVRADGSGNLTYRIHWHPNGYKVHRLNELDAPTCSIELLPEQLMQHALGKALLQGSLYTPAA